MCDTKNRPRICHEPNEDVCGWFDQHIQCFAYPCAINAVNKCEACKMDHVEKVTLGKCPKTGSRPSDNMK